MSASESPHGREDNLIRSFSFSHLNKYNKQAVVIFMNKLSSFSWLNKQTDPKGQHSLPASNNVLSLFSSVNSLFYQLWKTYIFELVRLFPSVGMKPSDRLGGRIAKAISMNVQPKFPSTNMLAW